VIPSSKIHDGRTALCAKVANNTEPGGVSARTSKQHTLSKEKTVMATPATRTEWTYKISACACALFLLFDLLTL
jgi:hypothetical protein